MTAELLLQKLESLPVEPGLLHLQGQGGRGAVRGQGQEPALARAQLLSGRELGRARVHPVLAQARGDLDTIVTLSEKEAAILENNLIKEHKPRFNVKLRDDKEYLSLRLSTEHAWPRLELVRKPKPDNARYFGPYHSATAARRTLHLVEKHFQLRTCSDREIESRKRPCLKYQIKRCPAPCVYDVDPAEYAGASARRVAVPGRPTRRAHARAQGAHARGQRKPGVRGGRGLPRPAEPRWSRSARASAWSR